MKIGNERGELRVESIKNSATVSVIPDVQAECFVIMPISDVEGYEKGHFERVYKDVFVPAIQKAGFKPFRADEDKGASLIQ